MAIELAKESTAPKRAQDLVKSSLQGGVTNIDDGDVLRRIAFSATEEVVISRGKFSWTSACFMCIFIVVGFASLILMVLSTRDSALELISEEISYIDTRNPPWNLPPWGYVKQPGDAPSRRIGQPFRFAMPQTTLYYSLCSASFGLFTVSYFCSELLVQDIGVSRVRSMGDIINSGVRIYVLRTVPIVIVFMCFVAVGVYFSSGLNFVISMLVGASTCMFCANLGTSMNFQGGPRLCHSLNYDLVASIHMGIRAGAIGGLSAHAMAQLGVVCVWILVRDAAALVGFGAGVSIVAFYNRIGGGIFAKGCDIGSDFISDMMGEDGDDYQMDNLDMLRTNASLHDKDRDGDVDDDFIERQRIMDPNSHIDEETVGFISQHEAALRAGIEDKMEQMLKTMHPVNYLDAIGENIADVGGTSSDLFETMCITLATGVIFGAKAHDAPYLGTSLPFIIISTGTLGCSLVSYYVWCHEKHSSSRIRNSLRLNLIIVMLLVQLTVCGVCLLHWRLWRTIQFDRMINYDLIVLLGLCAPELCALICEFFTSVNCRPVAWLARDAHLGMIQVILQGLGQGFVSAGVPSCVNILVQIIAFRLEGFYGLVLLAAASQSCTGWQATLAAYGAVANNANRMVHLTTVNEIAHRRGNVCAVIGTTTSHNGKCVAGQNAFFATTTLLGALMADKYTKLGKNFQLTVGQELSEFTRAGLLAGIVFTMLFLANTLTSCIQMSKRLVEFARENPDVAPRTDKTFPATHFLPLKKLVAFASIESFQLSISPLFQTFAAPLVIGQLFGFKGLLMLVSGGNSVCFSLNMFLVNAGQAWDAARKYILFGMLKDEKGNTVGAESEVYDTLGIGEQIGGPLEDLSGPALNNFIKVVAVASFVTSDLYDEYPYKTFVWGIGQVIINFACVSFFKFGLAWSIKQIEGFLRRRRERIDIEEGGKMLRELEMREQQIAEEDKTDDHNEVLTF